MAIATEVSLGTVALSGDLAGGSNATLPSLTPTGVIAGDFIAPSVVVDSKGRIVYAQNISNPDVPCAGPAQCGIVRVTDLHDIVNETGKISLKLASKDDYGVVMIGDGFDKDCCEIYVDFVVAGEVTNGLVIVPGSGNLVVSGPDKLSVPIADSSTNGVVAVGPAFSVVDGTVSYVVPTATTSVKGIAQVGEGFDVTSGTLSVLPASDTVLGAWRGGAGFVLTSGTYSYSVAATASTLGYVKVGSGLGVDVNGTLSRGSGDATSSSKGLVQVDAAGGLGIASGVLSFSAPDATSSTKGVVIPGTAMTVTSGVLSMNDATEYQAGIITAGASGTIAISSDGLIDFGPNLVRLEQANTFTKAQISQKYTYPTLASNNPVIDLSLSNVIDMTLNRTIVLNSITGTNLVEGGQYILILRQDSTGGWDLQWDEAYWKFFDSYTYTSNKKPSISRAPNSVSVVYFTVIDAATPTFLATMQNNFA